MSIGSTSSEEWFLASDFGAYVLFWTDKYWIARLAATYVWWISSIQNYEKELILGIEVTYNWLKVHCEIKAIAN